MFTKSVLRLLTKPRYLVQSIRTSLLKASGASDYRRWGTLKNIKPKWSERTQAMANVVPPGTRILEFGAGHQLLRRFLPDGCHYTPSDLADRGEGTIVCDLNAAELPPFEGFDVAFFAGVFEYIHDPARLAAHLKNHFRIVVASYCVIDQPPQDDIAYRRTRCWVNEYSEADFAKVFEDVGYRVDAKQYWKKQVIFRFTCSSMESS